MKRWFGCGRCAHAMLWLLALSTLAHAQAISVEVKPIRLTEHVYYVQGLPGMASRANQGFNSNAGFVVTSAGVVVFDALGTPPLGAALLKAIRASTDQPIKIVLVSHYHSDHFYGVQVFKDAGAEVWAHQSARAYLNSEAPAARLQERRQSLAPWVDENTRVVSADRWLQGDEIFELGGLRFRVYHFGPAHTDEDIGLMVEPDGVLFAGDLLFAGRIPFVGEADSRRWLAAIEQVQQHKPKLLIGGHGPASNDPAQDFALTRDYLIYLRQVMGAAAESFTPFEEAYRSADWSRFSHLPAFEPANRTNAYNTYLLMERETLGGGSQ